MRKHLLLTPSAAALASGAAHAQSAVTIYGFVDQAVGKNPGVTGTHVLDSTGSRLGFKGEEDLGDGLKASFLLEERFSPQTGQAATPFFKGGSWVGLGGSFGKVILGRWWTQAFLKSEFASDPFGMGTVGESFGTVGCGGPNGCVGAFWLDNSVSYEYSANGFSFGSQVAEAAPGGKRPYNVGLSYEKGGLYLGYGHETTGDPGAKWDHATVNYDFGVVKLISGYGTGTDALGDSRRNLIVGFTAPLGSTGFLIGSYNQHKDAGVTVQSKTSLGYQYYLSKRTKLFATLTNDSEVATSKSGFDLGILHSW
jgi:predicted porin